MLRWKSTWKQWGRSGFLMLNRGRMTGWYVCGWLQNASRISGGADASAVWVCKCASIVLLILVLLMRPLYGRMDLVLSVQLSGMGCGRL
jgi:hypothetical protein